MKNRIKAVFNRSTARWEFFPQYKAIFGWCDFKKNYPREVCNFYEYLFSLLFCMKFYDSTSIRFYSKDDAKEFIATFNNRSL